MRKSKKKAFALVELILGLSLIGLLASVIYPSLLATRLGLAKIEIKSNLIDQAQRITMILKPPSEKNNNLLNHLIEGDSINYDDKLLPKEFKANIYIDSISENYQVYTVKVKLEGDDISAEFQAGRYTE